MSIVSSSIADGVATVTLNDPDRRNSLNAEMVAALVDVFDAIEHDDEVRAVVLTGAPRRSVPVPTSATWRRPTAIRCAASTRDSCASHAARCRRSLPSTAPQSVPG